MVDIYIRPRDVQVSYERIMLRGVIYGGYTEVFVKVGKEARIKRPLEIIHYSRTCCTTIKFYNMSYDVFICGKTLTNKLCNISTSFRLL